MADRGGRHGHATRYAASRFCLCGSSMRCSLIARLIAASALSACSSQILRPRGSMSRFHTRLSVYGLGHAPETLTFMLGDPIGSKEWQDLRQPVVCTLEGAVENGVRARLKCLCTTVVATAYQQRNTVLYETFIARLPDRHCLSTPSQTSSPARFAGVCNFAHRSSFFLLLKQPRTANLGDFAPTMCDLVHSLSSCVDFRTMGAASVPGGPHERELHRTGVD